MQLVYTAKGKLSQEQLERILTDVFLATCANFTHRKYLNGWEDEKITKPKGLTLDIIVLYDEGTKPVQIAKDLNCSKQNVYRVLNTHRKDWKMKKEMTNETG